MWISCFCGLNVLSYEPIVRPASGSIVQTHFRGQIVGAGEMNSCPGLREPDFVLLFLRTGCGEVNPSLGRGPGCSLVAAVLAPLILAVSSAPPSGMPLPSSLSCWCWLPHPLLASTACVCYCRPGSEPGLAWSQTCGYSMYSECSAKFVIILDYFFFSNLEGVG